MANITILLPSNRNYPSLFLLAYLHLILAYFKGPGNEHFRCKHLGNGDRGNVTCVVQYELSIGIFMFELGQLKSLNVNLMH